MTNKEYKKLVYPDPQTPEFIDYLRQNNETIFEGSDWLIIANCKYHTEEKPHYTAFKITPEASIDELFGLIYALNLGSWHVYRNSAKDTSISRFHLHIVQDIAHYNATFRR